ncbi:MAG: alpha/beta hydrolase [Planctomycetaceae bacterium]|nr:alpha/beta hydrolase [Planctomycetaceae bacterium]
MTHHEDFFDAQDGLRLFEQSWRPDGATIGTVALIHGVTEHSGRYARLAEDLNRRGYALCAMDLRGHGRSDGSRLWVRRFDQYLDDAELFLERVSARYPERPLFLLGHSMGGAVVALLAATRSPDVQGVVLSAPAIWIGGNVFPVLRRLASLVSWVWPTLRVTHLGCRFLSRDPAVVEAFRNDPLVFHGRFPVRLGDEILRAARRIQENAAKVTLPVLALHGTGDFVTDPRGCRLLVSRARSSDKTLRLYEGLYHDLFNEPERDQIVTDLLDWLDDH